MKTFHELTDDVERRQAIANTVFAHLRKQGRRAVDKVRDVCVYRTADGLKCAVGCLIPDELYDKGIEGAGMSLDFTSQRRWKLWDILWNIGIRAEDGQLMEVLQMLHDSERNWGEKGISEDAIRDVCALLKLQYTPPK